MDDLINKPESEQEKNRPCIWLPQRAANSEEHAQMEAAYFAFKKTLDGQLPIPFRNAAGEIEDPNVEELKLLKTLGISVEEWKELVR